ncbi:MAG: chloride channel protein [Tepidisphaeraceae bacterium]
MPIRWSWTSHLAIWKSVLLWTLLAVPLGAVVGSAVAVFLWSLDLVTRTRLSHPWLLFTLPALGFFVGWVYHRLGRDAERGNNLIIEQIHQPGGGVPRRMAPLVLIGTLLTHLGGGSAGREGTAVQMGGSLAATIARLFRLPPAITGTLLTAGIAAGFGAVFGTPFAGAIFALEVLTIGRLSHAAMWPCLLAAVTGDLVCSAWNVQWLGLHFQIHHTHYAIASFAKQTVAIDPVLLAKVAGASVLFGLASVVFAELTHAIGHVFKKTIRYSPLRPAIGGVLVIGLTYALGTSDYLGLGVTPPSPGGVSIVTAFEPGGATAWGWAWKILFTAVTLGSGFKGGEVTPLFFVGATLGNALAGVFGARRIYSPRWASWPSSPGRRTRRWPAR